MTTYIITEDGDKIITEDGLDKIITEGSIMSKRYDIIQEVLGILEDITVVNGYQTNVAYVSDKMKISHPEELDKAQFPACMVIDEDEVKEPLAIFSAAGNDMRSTLTIGITSIVYSRTADTALARTNLMQDIEKSIVTDATLLAMLLEQPSPTEVTTDMGFFGNYSVFKQKFECEYNYNHNDGG